MNGIQLALNELLIFFIGSYYLKNTLILLNIDVISYYWLMFTILTGIWEFYYIFQKKKCFIKSKVLIDYNAHIWNTKYNYTDLLPDTFSLIFYSEYAAYADRQYMNLKNKWSLIIEGSHCDLCAIFSLISVISLIKKNIILYFIASSVSMGSQLMNSILYMSEYKIQTKDSDNINYNSINFPTGFLLCKRPFMWINIFWTIMPVYVIYSNIFMNKDIYLNQFI